MKRVLDVIVDGDLGKVSLRFYLGKLLYTLWIEEEGFSGKRPFGNSGWCRDVANALCAEGHIKSSEWESYDDDDEPEAGEWRFQWGDVSEVIVNAINETFDIQVRD